MPNCRKTTLRPNSKNDDFLTLGDAAHITAASEGGPRYDPKMTPEQRKDESNGIWLCKECAYIVDHDYEEVYSTQTLINFKRSAEKKNLSESRLRGDDIKDIINDLEEVITKINSFIYKYESNDPSVAYWNKITSPRLYVLFDSHCRERDRLKKEYSSEKLLEYNKYVLPCLSNVLFECQIVLGESDEDVNQAFTKFKINSLDLDSLKESVMILYKLKSVIEWR
jgi:hypothetical protein